MKIPKQVPFHQRPVSTAVKSHPDPGTRQRLSLASNVLHCPASRARPDSYWQLRPGDRVEGQDLCPFIHPRPSRLFLSSSNPIRVSRQFPALPILVFVLPFHQCRHFYRFLYQIRPSTRERSHVRCCRDVGCLAPQKWIGVVPPFFCKVSFMVKKLTWRFRIKGIAEGHRSSPHAITSGAAMMQPRQNVPGEVKVEKEIAK